MTKKYIIDTNVFIQGKNFHYNFDFCKGFWDWVEHSHAQGVVFSIQKVKDELMVGNKGDLARIWAQNMSASFFLEDVKDDKVMAAYREVMTWAAKDQHYQAAAIAKFSDSSKADAFLLAYAKAYGVVIVTQEFSEPNKKKEIPIPDAAIKIGGIKTIPIYDLLRKHASSTFVFKP
jgi:hypothetical protein